MVPAVEEGALRAVPLRVGEALDGHPLARFAVGEVDLGVAFEAKRLGDGLLLLRPDGTLLLRRAKRETVLARGVAPGIAVDGERLAFVAVADEGQALWAATATRAPSRVAGPLKHIDRARYLDEGRLLFVGSEPGGLPGLYLSDGRGARRLTNHGLRAGAGLPPNFVPPPVDAASVRPAGNGVRFCDGEQGWFVEIPSGAARRDAAGCP